MVVNMFIVNELMLTRTDDHLHRSKFAQLRSFPVQFLFSFIYGTINIGIDIDMTYNRFFSDRSFGLCVLVW